jgi:DinB family
MAVCQRAIDLTFCALPLFAWKSPPSSRFLITSAKSASAPCGLLPAFHATKSSGVRRRTSLRLATLPGTLPQPRDTFLSSAVGATVMPDAVANWRRAATRFVRFMERMHSESMNMLRRLSDGQLQQKCQSADGTPMTTWKVFRSMVEHEVHHRGELYAYLGVLGVSVPPLYGLTSEQLREIAGRPADTSSH